MPRDPESEKIRKAAWYQANKEARKKQSNEQSKAWRVNNPDKYREQQKAWRKAHMDKFCEYSAAWRARNPDKVKKYSAKYYRENIEEVKVRRVEWLEKNKEKVRANRAAYYQEHKEKEIEAARHSRADNPQEHRERVKRWRNSNPEKCKVIAHNRRARIDANGGKLSSDIIQILWKRQKGKCPACKADLRKTGYHLDHIVPISKGGKNDDRNVQLTCPTCNHKKYDKDPIQFMQEMGYLL